MVLYILCSFWILDIIVGIKFWFLKLGLIFIINIKLHKFKIYLINFRGVEGLRIIFVCLFNFLIWFRVWCKWGEVLCLVWIDIILVFVFVKFLIYFFGFIIIKWILRGFLVIGWSVLIINGLIVILGIKWLFIILIWI